MLRVRISTERFTQGWIWLGYCFGGWIRDFSARANSVYWINLLKVQNLYDAREIKHLTQWNQFMLRPYLHHSRPSRIDVRYCYGNVVPNICMYCWSWTEHRNQAEHLTGFHFHFWFPFWENCVWSCNWCQLQEYIIEYFGFSRVIVFLSHL